MFIWNMLGALILIPALARFLLAPADRNTKSASDAISKSAAA
jgi:hypothetical protein